MERAKCEKCGAARPPDETVCPDCGDTSPAQIEADPVEGEPGVYSCFKHKKEKTRLRCGRCSRAICTKCAVLGPAGARCPICAKNKIPISPRAIAHETRMSLRGLFVGGPYRYLWMLIVFSLVAGMFRSCQTSPPPPPPPIEDTYEPPPKG